MNDGVCIVIPSANRHRLHLLAATLAGMRKCEGIEQIIVTEMGTTPHAFELAQAHGAEHIFTHSGGLFDRSRMMNAGAALARSREILWCDGDFLFDPHFIVQAQREMRECGADYFYPHSRMDYLGEGDTSDVLAGVRHPRMCQPLRMMAPMTGNPGGMGMVSARFIKRHGGMLDGFRGWGCEDHAWLRKATLLGKVDVSHDPGQRVWHLFHPDSGSHSEQALRVAIRRNPHYAANAILMDRINAIGSGEAFLQQFPKPARLPSPWPAHARLIFVTAASDRRAPAAARAHEWGRRLERVYGLVPRQVLADPSAPDPMVAALHGEAIVGFADDPAGCHALMAALGSRLTLLVSDVARPGNVTIPFQPASMVFARTTAQRDLWAARNPVWHVTWQADGTGHENLAPPLVPPLSYLLGATRRWKIRIELDRQLLSPCALDRPRFWYVGLHDAEAIEVMREDMGGAELRRALSDSRGPIVIERAAICPTPPATWTIWPTDRHGRWLEKLSGQAVAEDLGRSWG